MTYDSLGHAAEERSGEPAATMGTEDEEIGALIFGHLDQGPAGGRMLNHAELHFWNALEKLGGLAG